jgi:hypothetical protein
MKNVGLFFIVIFLVGFSNQSHAEVRASFEGEWEYHDDGLDFGIHLHQKGNHLFGWHSGSTKNGNRTDTAVDGEGDPSIEGLIEGRTALVTVRSAYSDALLKVKLTLHKKNMDWEIVEVVKDGERYIPQNATLNRQH